MIQSQRMSKEQNEITKLIGQFELTHRVEDWLDDSIALWPLIRTKIGWRIRASEPASRQQSPLPTRGVRFAKRFFSRATKCKPIPSYNEPNVMILSYASRLIRTKNGLFENPVTDNISNRLSDRGRRVTNLQLGVSPGNTTLERYRIKLPQNHRRRRLKNIWFTEIESFFEAHHCDLANLQFETEELCGRVLTTADYFQSLLETTNTKLLLVDCWYHWDAMAAILAARRVGISVVEIQHGLISPSHFAYGGWTKSVESSLKPTHCWIWGNRDKETISRFLSGTIGSKNVLVGGNLFLSSFSNRDSDQESLPPKDRRQIGRMRRRFQRIGLITLQASFLPTTELLRRIQSELPEWGFLLRLHRKHKDSSCLRNIIDAVDKTKFQVCASPWNPLPSALLNCDCNITGFSTTTTEALAMGKPTVLIHELGNTVFSEQIKDGVVLRFDGIEKVAEKIGLSERIKPNSCKESAVDLFANESDTSIALDQMIQLAGA